MLGIRVGKRGRVMLTMSTMSIMTLAVMLIMIIEYDDAS